MKRWLSLPMIGTGSASDPYRPDLKGVGGIAGYVMAATNGTDCLVKVVRDAGPLDALKGKAGVTHHGDETSETVNGRTVYRIPANVRAVLAAEAERLGVGADWAPEGYDVNAE